MATPNKFSNPDTPGCDCLRGYADCLIIGPLKGVLCLPCVCYAWSHKNRQTEETGEENNKRQGRTDGTVKDQPARQVDMSSLPDASKPRDQWPASWRDPAAMHEAEDVKGAESGNGSGGESKSLGDRLAGGIEKTVMA